MNYIPLLKFLICYYWPITNFRELFSRYLHEACSPSVIHKNIKSSNIFLDLELNPRLSDYGLATFHQVNHCLFASIHFSIAFKFTLLLQIEEQEITSFCSIFQRTSQNLGMGYNAPECTKPSAYTMKSDVYSFGVVMLELLTGSKPVDRCVTLVSCSIFFSFLKVV